MLVTVSDLSKYMDVRFSNRQEEAAEFVLEGLQAELEAFLNRPIEVSEFEEIHVLESNHVGVPMDSFFHNNEFASDKEQMLSYATPPSTIYLDNSPVTNVSEVTIQGPTETAPRTLTEGTDYVVRRYGIDCYTSFANDKVVITYTAGLAGDNIKVFKIMILRAATREMQNMHDDVVGIKDLETRNVAPMETGFLEKELLAVKRYRRNRIA